MSYDTGTVKYKVASSNAMTATLTTTERRPGAHAELPSQIVLTWPTARPADVVDGSEFLIQIR